MTDRKQTLTYFYNALFLTMDDDAPQSHHLLAQGNTILHCTANDAPFGLNCKNADFAEKMKSFSGDIEFVDLQGATVLPGLCDAHAHLLCFADTLNVADLTTATSEDEAAAMLLEHAIKSPPQVGGWVRGHGWIHNYWDGCTTPTRRSLDRLFPDTPVFATSKCLHLAWINTAGIRALGLHKDSEIPMGGELPFDADGELTGLLIEEAGDMAMDMLPKLTQTQRLELLLAAQAIAHSQGLTAFNCPETAEDLQVYQQAATENKLRVRIVFHPYFGVMDDYINAGIRHGFGDDWLRIGGIKAMMDGSLGGRTAFMYAPYEGELENCGRTVVDYEVAREIILKANENGFPAVIHAIGDRAVGDVLRLFEEAAALYPEMRRRNSIEHLQLIAEEDIALLKKLQPIASIQPVHLCADIRPADQFWGGRSRFAYAIKTVQDAGCLLSFGSDVPVEPFNPFFSIHAAVNRQSLSDSPDGGWYPEECISVYDALKAFTAGAAVAGGGAVIARRGTLSKGKLADFIVLRENPLTMPKHDLRKITPLATWVDGECVYRQPT